MDFTLTELRMLTNAIATEILRIEDKKHFLEKDKEKIRMLLDLGDRIDEEKIRKLHKIKNT